ncbi:DUF1697 domain-containing protein [Croceitalea sp. MTPC9]|uniref:DUF1697 domain-containing protein n=1 Tax=unclassified Croceitalea TaxID=2632280 RepID=UPI002B39F2E6|nr:DUF1697 domain-containing protein [Croceitalea sp. MTPC6]GMN17006.1 DUF1697 domain-containing protein [Croceitalea sp. MTPC9]
MQTYIAFLRGINVGGQKKIKMADLRVSLEQAGFKNVQTYIQSGNLILDSHVEDLTELSQNVYKLILRDFGFEVPILIKTSVELSKILTNMPFLNAEEKNLYFTLLHGFPDEEWIKEFNALRFKTEEFKLIDTCVYLNCKKGAGRAKLNNNLIERKLKVIATTRNLRTMQKMIEFAG